MAWVSFGDYLRGRPRGYTEAAYALRQALLGMPLEVQTRPEVYAWLAESGASGTVVAQARVAWDSYVDFLSGRNRGRR